VTDLIRRYADPIRDRRLFWSGQFPRAGCPGLLMISKCAHFEEESSWVRSAHPFLRPASRARSAAGDPAHVGNPKLTPRERPDIACSAYGSAAERPRLPH